MAALVLKITAAGRAALRNAAGNGTNAVLVATAGVTATAFAPGSPLPDEIKRIATIAGGATAADTIHVTISDTTDGASYSVRGFGIYLTDGTLFASYGQADVIVQKSAQAAMLLAVDVQFADVDARQITFGDANFSNPQATTERLGVSELATDDETVAGADSTRTVTPKGLLAALNARLGLGAPSDFVKSLLGIVKADAFRLALGIHAAATYDTGSGNGLDADLLDGREGAYYRSFANLTDVPAAFPPTAHTHDAGDITSGILPLARGGTGLGAVAAGSFLSGAVKAGDPLVPRTPAQVLTDIGAAAKAHSHAMGDVIGLSDALDGKAAKAHTHAMGDVIGLGDALAGKAAKVHGHSIGDVTDLQAWLDGKVSKAGDTMSGSLGVGGTVTFGTYLSSSGFNAIVSASGGTVFLRPLGPNQNANEVTVDPSGVLTVTGGGLRVGSTTGTFRGFGFDGVVTSNQAISPSSGSGTLVLTVSGAFGGGYCLRDGDKSIGLWSNSGNLQIGFGATGGALNSQVTISTGGAITANGGFQWSDRHLKKQIKRKPVIRGLAIQLARYYSSWLMRENDTYGEGIVAQTARRLAPAHVGEEIKGKRGAKRLTVDKAGLALEASCDNALSIAELTKRLARLERKHA